MNARDLKQAIADQHIKKMTIINRPDALDKACVSISCVLSTEDGEIILQEKNSPKTYKTINGAIKAIQAMGWVGDVMHLTYKKNYKAMTIINLT